MVVNPDAIRILSAIPAFVDFAHEKMRHDADLWRHESEFGSGVMKAIATAVVEIGGDPK